MMPCCELSGMWFGVTSRTNTKNTHAEKKIGLCAQYRIIILGLIVNIIEGDLYDH